MHLINITMKNYFDCNSPIKINSEFLYQMQKFAFHQIFEYCMNTYNVMLNACIHFISPRASCICLHIIYLILKIIAV